MRHKTANFQQRATLARPPCPNRKWVERENYSEWIEEYHTHALLGACAYISTGRERALISELRPARMHAGVERHKQTKPYIIEGAWSHFARASGALYSGRTLTLNQAHEVCPLEYNFCVS